MMIGNTIWYVSKNTAIVDLQIEPTIFPRQCFIAIVHGLSVDVRNVAFVLQISANFKRNRKNKVHDTSSVSLKLTIYDVSNEFRECEFACKINDLTRFQFMLPSWIRKLNPRVRTFSIHSAVVNLHMKPTILEDFQSFRHRELAHESHDFKAISDMSAIVNFHMKFTI